MATADIVLIFGYILLIIFMVILVKLIKTLKAKINRNNLEIDKKEADNDKFNL